LFRGIIGSVIYQGQLCEEEAVKSVVMIQGRLDGGTTAQALSKTS